MNNTTNSEKALYISHPDQVFFKTRKSEIKPEDVEAAFKLMEIGEYNKQDLFRDGTWIKNSVDVNYNGAINTRNTRSIYCDYDGNSGKLVLYASITENKGHVIGGLSYNRRHYERLTTYRLASSSENGLVANLKTTQTQEAKGDPSMLMSTTNFAEFAKQYIIDKKV